MVLIWQLTTAKNSSPGGPDSLCGHRHLHTHGRHLSLFQEIKQNAPRVTSWYQPPSFLSVVDLTLADNFSQSSTLSLSL